MGLGMGMGLGLGSGSGSGSGSGVDGEEGDRLRPQMKQRNIERCTIVKLVSTCHMEGGYIGNLITPVRT